MNCSKGFVRLFLVVLLVFVVSVVGQPVFAALITTGEVFPVDPSTWSPSGTVYVGYVGTGSVVVDGGTSIVLGKADLGRYLGSTGTVSVDGVGSTWTNSRSLYVGRYGSGTLNITNNAEVSVQGEAFISFYNGSSGTIYFNNGTLSTNGLLCAADELTGTGTINANGLVTDLDLVFDATHGSSQTLNINDNPGQDITLYLDVDGSGVMGAGYRGVGSMSISEGKVIESTSGYLGYKSGSTGTVSVDGTGSTWNNDDHLYVGREGNGTLNITGGAMVLVTHNTQVSGSSGSSGTIHFNNGTLSTDGLLCAADDLTGTGTIYAHGLVTDLDLVFDATHGLSQTLNINGNPRQNITLNLDVDGSSAMGAGYDGAGSMSINDGLEVASTFGLIGYRSGSDGTVTVSGPGSTWACSESLYVGKSGNGALEITDGAAVSNYNDGQLGVSYGSGIVTVDGAGSTWISQGITVGGTGNGTLNITGGGIVSSSSGNIGRSSDSTGEVTVDGAGSRWNSTTLVVGDEGSGKLNITSGGTVSNPFVGIGRSSGSTGEVTVDGADSLLYSYSISVGSSGNGTLNIANGGSVSNVNGYLSGSWRSTSEGEVTVDGAGSTWSNRGSLNVGQGGDGTLNITDGGLVSVVGQLMIDENGFGDSFVNMATGGMLAIGGKTDESIGQFLGLVEGTDALRYWDGGAWAHISGATAGSDYTLEYLTGGELDGFTKLTVMTAVPEPSTIAMLLALVGLTMLRWRR
jgi:T5SS/PEP-CTERM-associated repeat protein